jgi:hypothetical protein
MIAPQFLTFSNADTVTIDADNITNWPTGTILQAYDGNLDTLSSPGNWKVFYSDAAGTVQTLTEGAEGTGLCFHGAAAPTACTLSGAPGGSNTQVQVNVSGVFVGYSWFFVDPATNTVTMDNVVINDSLLISQSSTSAGEYDFYELSGNGAEYVGLKAPNSLSDNVVWTLPSTDAAGVMVSNGSGVLSLSTTVGTSLSVTGTLDGLVPILTNDLALDSTQVKGHYNRITSTATVVISQTAAVGQSFCIKNSTAATTYIDPYSTDVIVLNGVPLPAGYRVNNNPTVAGDFICFICDTAGYWESMGVKGTWENSGS